MKRYILSLLFVCFVLLPVRALAAEWVIDRFASDIAVQSDGRVKVTETIEVDFKSEEKHGIYRDIPIVYQGQTGKTYTEIEVEQVLQDGQPAIQETETNNAYLRIQIGEPDRVISGRHVYVLTYTATGVLRNASAGVDELYWNVTGNNWEVPIRAATATVTLPDGLTVSQIACYVGPTGSTTPCDQAEGNGTAAAQFSTSTSLEPGDGLTVAVGYAAGSLPILAVEPPADPLSVLSQWSTWAGFGVALLGGLVWITRRWLQSGRDARGKSTVVPEYEAPLQLRPAEIGVLVDERADTLDVSATIVDLAVRDYLTITEIPKKWAFGSTDYELQRTDKRAASLLDYEIKLLEALFRSGQAVKLSALKNTFYTDLAEVKRQLYIDLSAKQFFAMDPDTVRQNYMGWGVLWMVLGLAGAFGLAFLGIGWLAGLVGGLGATGLLMLLTARAMPARTELGAEVYRQALGYELFINTAEKYRARFAERENLFTELLPYAIVFGATKKLAQAMEVMELQPANPVWYHGIHPFQPAVFAADVDSFSRSLSTAIASTPSGSGSGGGGFSGGGFGGGGGGSW